MKEVENQSTLKAKKYFDSLCKNIFRILDHTFWTKYWSKREIYGSKRCVIHFHNKKSTFWKTAFERM